MNRLKPAAEINLPKLEAEGEDKHSTFKLLDCIARGSQSDVHIAKDNHERLVALKLLHPDDDTNRAQREIAVHSERSGHPAIIELLDSGNVNTGEKTLPYISMPLKKGTLNDLKLDQASSNIDRVERLAKAVHPMLIALEGLHGINLVHRDFKPSNGLIDGNGEGYLSDFGAVGVDGEEEAYMRLKARFGTKKLAFFDSLTQTEAVIGTPGYTAPERLMGESCGSSASSDMFGVGATVYYLITGGKLPWDANGSLETYTQNLAAHTIPPEPEKISHNKIPRELSAFTLRLLARDAQSRQTAGEAADELYALAS